MKAKKEAAAGFLKSQRGEFMLEAVIAVIIFTLVGTAVLSGVSFAHRLSNGTEGQSVAENIGRTQMERVFNEAYQPPPYTYPTIQTPTGYSVTAQAEEYISGEAGIQKVVVTVTRDSDVLLILETIRTND